VQINSAALKKAIRQVCYSNNLSHNPLPQKVIKEIETELSNGSAIRMEFICTI
jgi:hypothetical protein